MAKYKRRSNYYQNENSNDELADGLSGLFAFFILFLFYKFYTDRVEFWQWIFYIIAILIGFIALIAILVNRKNNKDTQIENISTGAEDLGNVVVKEVSEKRKYDKQRNIPTRQAEALYNALIKKGIKCEKEKWDGFKHIDIAIPWAKLNIEIDGIQHYTDSRQVIADMSRTHYSQKKGYHTQRFPNFAIDKDLEGVATSVAEMAKKRYSEMKNKD
jgi:very-short-patch-repair endonuclease